MKQILQNFKNGDTFIAESPVPQVLPGHLLIKTKKTLISPGTERMLVEFGKSNLIEKALKEPHRVIEVVNKIKTDGLFSTFEAVNSKLDTPIPLGYSNVGIVEEVGEGVIGFNVGDRVVSNGSHAEVVCIPENLCSKIPENVCDEEAVFTIISSIGLQGIRLLKPQLGEKIVVIGAGLIGILTSQLLNNSGCDVLAVDYDEKKLEILQKHGIATCCINKGQNIIDFANSFSKNRGVDGVIITASSSSNQIISEAAQISRKRGKIILVGVTGLNIKREDFYQKEISFQVSCSYGPGRYDKSYEEEGNDYPFSYVRWTEKRNFEAILDIFDSNKLDVKNLISSEYDFENVNDAFDELLTNKSALGILIDYSKSSNKKLVKTIKNKINYNFDKAKINIGLIGAGNYATRILVPCFKNHATQFHTVCSQGGISGSSVAKKYAFTKATTDSNEIFKNEEIDTVVIATRHNSHANYVCEAIKNDKHVFVEKPLAININELKDIQKAYKKSNKNQLMVGFNRRFSPLISYTKPFLDNLSEPKTFIATINAGKLPDDHWNHDFKIGGGRIIGEACHFIDLLRHLSGHKITYINSRRIGNNDSMKITEDKCSITLGFEDGSFGTIFYLANGSKAFPKERIEVFSNEKVIQIDNFRSLKFYGWNGVKNKKLWRQNKGQKECINIFCESLKNGTPAIDPEEIFEVAEATIKASEILKNQ